MIARVTACMFSRLVPWSTMNQSTHTPPSGSQISVTLGTDSHVVPELAQDAARRMGEADGSHFRERGLIRFAQFLSHAQSRVAVIAKKVQKIRAADEIAAFALDDFHVRPVVDVARARAVARPQPLSILQ